MMDPVVVLEHQIAELLRQQKKRGIKPARYWQLQDEIDTLNAQAQRLTAQQREAPRS